MTVVDDDVDVFDDRQVLWAVNVRFRADRDLVNLGHARGIRMDPSAVTMTTPHGVDSVTATLGFDATQTLESEIPERADLPHFGYEQFDVSPYLPTEAQAGVRTSDAWRVAHAE